MKEIGSKVLLGLGLAVMVSCDSGGGSGEEPNQVVTPPENISQAVNENSTSPTSSGAEVSLESVYQAEILEKINADRAAVGLNALESDSRLISLGQQHNSAMAQQAKSSGSSDIQISHDNFSDRAEEAFTFGYNLVGENVGGIRGYAQEDVSDAFVNGWNNSPGHRENIVGDYSHTGIAVYVDPEDGTVYATQLFGRRP